MAATPDFPRRDRATRTYCWGQRPEGSGDIRRTRSTSRSSTPTTTCTRRPEALTKYLPTEYSRRHRLRRGRRPHEDRRPRPDQRTTSRTRRSSVVARARRAGGVLQGRQPGRQVAAARSWASRSRRCPPSATRRPGSSCMDELGIDRALMLPTLASLVEERLRDDPDATHVVIHALNQWMHEHWTFNYEDRIFPTPVITLPDRRRGDRGARVGGRAAAPRSSSIRPGPGPRLPRAPVVRPARVRPVLGAGGRGRRRSSAMHASDSGYQRYLNEWEGSRRRVHALREPHGVRAMLVGHRGRSWTPWPRSIVPRPLHPLPAAQASRPSRTAAAGCAPSSTTWQTSTSNPARRSPRTRSRSSSATSTSTRSTRRTRGLVELIGADHVLFGSDYPHPEGLADPIMLVDDLEGLPGGRRPQGDGRQHGRLLGWTPRSEPERHYGGGSSSWAENVWSAFGAMPRHRPDHHLAVIIGPCPGHDEIVVVVDGDGRTEVVRLGPGRASRSVSVERCRGIVSERSTFGVVDGDHRTDDVRLEQRRGIASRVGIGPGGPVAEVGEGRHRWLRGRPSPRPAGTIVSGLIQSQIESRRPVPAGAGPAGSSTRPSGQRRAGRRPVSGSPSTVQPTTSTARWCFGHKLNRFSRTCRPPSRPYTAM